MPAPGSEVIGRQSPPTRSQPVSTGAWFIAGLAARGPVDKAETVLSPDQLLALYGEEVAYGLITRMGELFFQEGGAILNVIRVVGPAAKSANGTAKNEAEESTVKYTAVNPGAWANTLKVKVKAGEVGGSIVIEVLEGEEVLETSTEVSSVAAGALWAEAHSDLIRLQDLGKGLPKVGTTELKEGTDDRGSIEDKHWAAALNLFTDSMGHGQVSMPGRVTAAAYNAQLAHAEAFNRRALLDGADSSNRATLLGEAANGRASANADKGGLFGSWHLFNGVVKGTTRTAPQSVVVAAAIARNASAGRSPNTAAAGDKFGRSLTALGLTQPEWTNEDREILNNAGCNVAQVRDGIPTNMGFRTLVDGDADDTWLLLSNVGLYMELTGKFQKVADRYDFDEIDGKRKVFAKFKGELIGECLPYYSAGSLYGETPQDAFFVDTGPSVNTLKTIAGRKILAVVEVIMSPFGENVQIFVTKRALTEGVGV